MTAHCTNISHALDHQDRHGVFARLMTMVAVHRQRRALAQLDDRALQDIGVSRYEAEIEAARPAWDVPHHWMG